jgi:ribonuclease HII
MMDTPDLLEETALWAVGISHVAGIDEAGRGAWAGPVAAGAVILPPDPAVAGCLGGVRDSKQMTPAQREFWAVQIRSTVLAWGVGFASHDEVDDLGLLVATRLAMLRAVQMMPITPVFLLIDAVKLATDIPQRALIKGDARCLSIAAASVLAKTARDACMVEQGLLYPGYGFHRHKGYGTAAHQEALLLEGVCPIHRRSFAPVRNLIAHGCLWLEDEAASQDALF